MSAPSGELKIKTSSSGQSFTDKMYHEFRGGGGELKILKYHPSSRMFLPGFEKKLRVIKIV